jgi:hypothetical protein
MFAGLVTDTGRDEDVFNAGEHWDVFDDDPA